MPEEAGRWVVIGAAAVVILVVALWSRLSGDRSRVRATAVMRPDLAPGVHLFSSDTCTPCQEARRVVDTATGGAFAEVRFEDDPARFGSFGIGRVPAVVVVGEGGEGLLWEGIPAARDLRRAILERTLPAA